MVALVLFVGFFGGAWLFVRVVRNAWKKK